MTDAPSGAEKRMGFEGSPDPATGFYCHYNDGKLVERSDDAKAVSKGRSMRADDSKASSGRSI